MTFDKALAEFISRIVREREALENATGYEELLAVAQQQRQHPCESLERLKAATAAARAESIDPQTVAALVEMNEAHGELLSAAIRATGTGVDFSVPQRHRDALGRLFEIVGLTEPASDIADPDTEPTADDDSAYVPAGELRKGRSEFTRADQLTRFLAGVNSDRVVIRTRKPAKNRLLIHGGDWHAYWKRQDEMNDDALDGVADHIADIEARKVEARQRRRK